MSSYCSSVLMDWTCEWEEIQVQSWGEEGRRHETHEYEWIEQGCAEGQRQQKQEMIMEMLRWRVSRAMCDSIMAKGIFHILSKTWNYFCLYIFTNWKTSHAYRTLIESGTFLYDIKSIVHQKWSFAENFLFKMKISLFLHENRFGEM